MRHFVIRCGPPGVQYGPAVTGLGDAPAGEAAAAEGAPLDRRHILLSTYDLYGPRVTLHGHLGPRHPMRDDTTWQELLGSESD